MANLALKVALGNLHDAKVTTLFDQSCAVDGIIAIAMMLFSDGPRAYQS